MSAQTLFNFAKFQPKQRVETNGNPKKHRNLTSSNEAKKYGEKMTDSRKLRRFFLFENTLSNCETATN